MESLEDLATRVEKLEAVASSALEANSALSDAVVRLSSEVAVLSGVVLLLGGSLEQTTKHLPEGFLEDLLDGVENGLFDDETVEEGQRILRNFDSWRQR